MYGRSGDFRDACRDALLSYVVIIPCDYRVALAKGSAKVKAEEEARGAVFEERSAAPPRRCGWTDGQATQRSAPRALPRAQ